MTDADGSSDKATELKDQQETVERRAEKLDTAVIYRSEAGAFEGKPPREPENILKRVKDARSAASNGEIAEAHKQISLGFTELHAAVRSKSWWWRFVHIHAVPLFVYYLAFLVGLMLVGLWADHALTIWGVPIIIVVFGTLGGVLRGLWWIYKKVQTRTLRTQFTMVYIAGPWLGGLLGMFAWVLIKGGLLFLSGPGGEAGNGTGTETTVTTTPEGMNAVAFLAGYSWEWVVGRVQQFSDGNK